MVTKMIKSSESNSKRITAYIVLWDKNKFLLVQEAIGSIRGSWGLPGGGVNKDETPEQAISRETFEEVGYVVGSIEKIGVYTDPQRNSIRHLFRGEIKSGTLTLHPDELISAKWCTHKEINNLKLRGEWVNQAIGIPVSKNKRWGSI